MAKQKTIPQLEAEKAENERKLSQLQHKKQQIENRITYYEKGDRRKRAHHLITRGAAIESVATLAGTKTSQGNAGRREGLRWQEATNVRIRRCIKPFWNWRRKRSRL
ncbi:MAG: DUF3847 domain-containing protein [Christensenellales bacterium]|jgi:hypothetical protein